MVEIERAGIEDAAQVLALQRLAYQSEALLYEDPTLPPLRQTLAELEAEYADHVILKAVADGEIVGTVRAQARDGVCHIGRLAVHPQWQGQGIGTSLMARIEASFPEVARFELFTGTRSEANIRLYGRLGYTPVRTEPISALVTLVYLAKSAGCRDLGCA